MLFLEETEFLLCDEYIFLVFLTNEGRLIKSREIFNLNILAMKIIVRCSVLKKATRTVFKSCSPILSDNIVETTKKTKIVRTI